MPAKIAVRERLSHRDRESFIERVIGLAAIPEVEHVRLPRFHPCNAFGFSDDSSSV